MMPIFLPFCIPRNYLVVFLYAPWTVCMCVHACVCHLQLFASPGTIACQAPLSMAFSRQEYWSGLPFPPPGDLPDAGIKLHLLYLGHWQVDSLPLSNLGMMIPWTVRYVISQFLRHLL